MDYGEHAKPAEGELSTLSGICRELLAAELDVSTADAALKSAKTSRTELARGRVVEAFDAAGTEEFKLAGGAKVVLELAVECSLNQETPPERRAAIVGFLREQGHGAVIRSTVSVSFPPGDPRVDEAVNLLTDKGWAPSAAETVHPSTLGSVLKQIYKSGVALPESLGAWIGRQARVKFPKKQNSLQETANAKK